MNAKRMMLGATALAVLVGCGRDQDEVGRDRTPYEELVVTADTAEGWGSEQPMPVTPTQGGATIGGPLTVTGNLQGTRADSPPGSVTLSEAEGGTRVQISITGAVAGAEFQPALVANRCNQAGEPIHTADQIITIDDSGIATLEYIAPISTESLLDGRHSVQLTTPRAQATADVVLACADLPEASGTQ